MKSIVAAVVAALTISISGGTAAEPRPSWNNGNAKAAITATNDLRTPLR
jgi:hypothetical protein